jgi:hypothetical protein
MGFAIFWRLECKKIDKQAERYEEYYFEKKKEYEELHKKANRLALTLTGQLIDNIITILINSEVPNNEQSKIITKDDEYIIDSKVTKTKSYVFWGDEDE